MVKFEEKIKYTFKNKALLKEALTHSSYSKNTCNERLEFLGDSVLSVVVSKHLFETLKTQTEGYLTKLRASLVCESSLYGFAKKIGLGEAILLGKGEENTGGRDRKSILADAFEAVIAAIYLDGGPEAAANFILPFLPSVNAMRSGRLIVGDYKTVLQELIQKDPNEKIRYELVEETGLAHNRTFTSIVLRGGSEIGKGTGASKKESEQQAARSALIGLGQEIE